jgi:hypothetical protein
VAGLRSRLMDREALRGLVDQENVDPAAYDIDGRAAAETYVLQPSGGSFAVFYSERGLRTGERRFDTEHVTDVNACAV